MMTRTAIFFGALVLIASASTAQTQPVQTAAPPALPLQGFESENAILDTSIPFASGAREARQELRGSFGWSTFQEGQVQGVYYRFDPDGYARFSTTPRLDSDVFEVICRPRTLTCMGRKGSMTVTLSPAGQLQLGLENTVVGDRFFLTEGLSEVPLPDRVLQPLDPQLEALLSTGAELVVRRGDQDAQRHSLAGFYPVAAYLRWISARQDYAALPRDWPVPNANALSGQSGARLLATPQPVAPAYTQATPAPAPAAPRPGLAGVSTEVAEVRGELNMLRQMLLEQNSAPAPVSGQTSSAGQQHATDHMAPHAASGAVASSRLGELEQTNKMLLHELQRLRAMSAMPNGQVAPPVMTPGVTTLHGGGVMADSGAPASGSGDTAQVAQQTAARLEYLMTEIGLDAKTALLLIQSNQEAQQVASGSSEYQDALVSDILAELQGQMPSLEDVSTAPMGTVATRPTAPQGATGDEFVLLSDYFKSVMAQR